MSAVRMRESAEGGGRRAFRKLTKTEPVAVRTTPCQMTEPPRRVARDRGEAVPFVEVGCVSLVLERRQVARMRASVKLPAIWGRCSLRRVAQSARFATASWPRDMHDGVRCCADPLSVDASVPLNGEVCSQMTCCHPSANVVPNRWGNRRVSLFARIIATPCIEIGRSRKFPA
jgi:hypothetical protein